MTQRALAVMHCIKGAKIYFNDRELALASFSQAFSKQSWEPGLLARQSLVASSMEAQLLLYELNGYPSQNLGAALTSAQFLPKHSRRALDALRKLANKAKHEWEPNARTNYNGFCPANNVNSIPSRLDYSVDDDLQNVKHNIQEPGPSWKIVTDK
eukprot:gnl/MRDRNA2_/MRDRNA2_14732_c0_seq1.p1 gnl/MRDRNA2_/MRDRNA2_14732_c0~~gnl/MRDRNA2_/MRDRNA2_14732_c0_seq1.p1  ORF type:complete len:155 (+),score=20.71 gnl/MRDRNA2_/MRDRNA2_14732_c0_seq1:109-573(+)